MNDEDTTAVRLLTRHFIRRLLDNDLISPHADRHESLAVLYAVVLSLAVFITFFVAAPYLSSFIQLPGPTALSALPDRFLFIAASMAVCALAALLVWDALALEPRDTAILGPLPIPSSTITRAKLVAALAPPPHEMIGQPFGARRMGYVQTETRRGWGLGGSPKGDRRGLSLADARHGPVVGAAQDVGRPGAPPGRRSRVAQSAPWRDGGEDVGMA
jgi:hypothetical protein